MKDSRALDYQPKPLIATLLGALHPSLAVLSLNLEKLGVDDLASFVDLVLLEEVEMEVERLLASGDMGREGQLAMLKTEVGGLRKAWQGEDIAE
jgi:hypothetical protein